MKKTGYLDENIKIEGVFDFAKTHRFRRYTDEIIEKYPRLAETDKKCTGARMRFKTDSKKIRIEMKVSNRYVDRGMSFYQANVANVFVGDYSKSVFAGIMTAPDSYDSEIISIEFENGGLNDITVFLPRNPTVEDITVFTDDGAFIGQPDAHAISKPFVFYGSSITEQGHTSTPNSYTSLLSRFFDADFYNFGASGNAQGEPEIAEFTAKIPKSIFFYDYDHNAPTVEHLENTHEAFFRKFREKDPLTPVIMTSRPADDGDNFEKRAATVRKTYENAVAGGDKNVYFIDGKTLFGDVEPQICTTDRTHPNDLGHYLMAKTVEKFIRENNIL